MFSFITHFRNQPSIFQKHLEIWDGLPEGLRERWEFIAIDDCSDPPLLSFVGTRPYLRMFRSLSPMEWNYGLKNLGAKQALGDWLMLTNADHVLSAEAMIKINSINLDPTCYYQFGRYQPELNEQSRYNKKSHIGTLMIHRAALAQVGGYDEDFSGHYGHDDTFLLHCLKTAKFKKAVFNDIKLRCFSQSREVPDADFVDKPQWSRDLKRNEKLLSRKLTGPPVANPPILRFKWEPVA